MTSMRAQGWRGRLLVGLCWFVALEFVLLAPLKFFPNGALGWPPYPEKFEMWGYPSYMSYVVGAGELLAGVLLMFPRRRFLGAVIIIVILIGATVTHVINHDKLADSVSAPVHLAFAVIIALAYWPANWREPLTLRPSPDVEMVAGGARIGAASIR
jgi:uncharacterized membrane protein YphA (DoxX/SURF4 family)